MMSQQDGEAPRPDLVTGVTSLEKAAQGGHGLITSGFDLGVLTGRNNVDDEMRQQSGASSGSSQYSSGSSQHSSSGSQHSSSSSKSNVQYSGGRTGGSSNSYTGSASSSNLDGQDEEYEDDEYENADDDYDNSQNSRNGQITHSFSRHSSQSQSNRDNPEFTLYRRTRDLTHQGGENSLCQSAHCVNVRCVVGPLEKNAGALVALRMRLVAHTLQKVAFIYANKCD